MVYPAAWDKGVWVICERGSAARGNDDGSDMKPRKIDESESIILSSCLVITTITSTTYAPPSPPQLMIDCSSYLTLLLSEFSRQFGTTIPLTRKRRSRSPSPDRWHWAPRPGSCITSPPSCTECPPPHHLLEPYFLFQISELRCLMITPPRRMTVCLPMLPRSNQVTSIRSGAQTLPPGYLFLCGHRWRTDFTAVCVHASHEF
ncbi:hypothetical protein HOY80DRAFT_25996 [Tuber brumale]|nr:hypothetical protein HOY80DRAFT_25996 [Tuber brumale]